MNWQTEVPVTPGSPKITYGQPILVTGSCFAQHLGDKLAYFGYQHLTNPFGVIFHPLPLVRLLERAVDGREFTCDDLFENNGLWFCLETHSSLYAKSSDALLVLLNDKLKTCREYIAKSSHLVLTLGTGWGLSLIHI